MAAPTSFEVENDTEVQRASFKRRVSDASERLTQSWLSQGDERLRLGGAQPGLSKLEATANITISALGAGMVVFPSVMANVGVVNATTLCIIATAIAYAVGLMLLDCCNMAESMSGTSRTSIGGYEDMVQKALGNWGKVLLTLAKNLYFSGIIVVYFTFETLSLQLWLPDFMTPTVIRWCVVMPIFLCLAMLRDLTVVARFTPVGIVAVLSQSFGILLGCLYEIFVSDRPDSPPKNYVMMDDNLAKLGPALSTFIFGYGFVATLPSLRTQMSNADDLSGALRGAIIIVGAVYLITMGLGYLAFGSSVKDDIITSIGGETCQGFQCVLGKLVGLSIILNLFISMPTFAFCINSSLESTGSSVIHTPLTLPNIICRALFILCLCFISYQLSYAKQIIAILSAVFSISINYFFPVFSFHALQGLTASRVTRNTCRLHAVIVGIGGLTMCFGVSGGIRDLWREMSTSPSAENIAAVY
eukprot:TRINITY_DN35074_c0_g1_i1.p1 TRINITY_DN35074_c0_g1~~TRINITY_DN35074_c0_g1_i1.p1  ORF type:complete len:473 (+),score=67.14 TRINITY_DN35074_c0_g1_i1:177-1595(+)